MNKKYTTRKGRKLSNLIKNKILKSFPHLKDEDVGVAGTGQNGPDLVLSRIAKRLIPYQIEAKSQQRLSTVYTWYKQAGKKTNLEPIVCMRQNGKNPLVVMSLDHFFELIK
jgi:hypothetical protein